MLLDVNVLVDAHRADSPHFTECSPWLTQLIERGSARLCELSILGFPRIVTHLKIFAQPTPQKLAWKFADKIRRECRRTEPGPEHWRIFSRLCEKLNLHGQDLPDAYLAAIALEADLSVVTYDTGFARFPGLTVVRPG